MVVTALYNVDCLVDAAPRRVAVLYINSGTTMSERGTHKAVIIHKPNQKGTAVRCVDNGWATFCIAVPLVPAVFFFQNKQSAYFMYRYDGMGGGGVLKMINAEMDGREVL